jgi:hypothetical protein
MTDPWDEMISGDDAEVSAEIAADLAAYTKHLARGEFDACIRIEKKYGLFGLSPQMVSEQMAEMAKPTVGGES